MTVCQVLSFLVLPPLTFGVQQLLSLSTFFNPYILVGFLVMACVPTTVSSCSVLAKAAGGNEIAAVLNSIVGNTLGVRRARLARAVRLETGI